MKESVFQSLEQIRENWPEYNKKIVPEVMMFFQIEELLEKTVLDVSKQHGIQRGDFEVMFCLRAGSKNRVLSPTEIYTKLGLSSGGLTKILYRLSDKELIERLANKDDKRSSLVRLTPLGEKRLCTVLDGIVDRDQSFFETLNNDERNQLQTLFKKLLTRSKG